MKNILFSVLLTLSFLPSAFAVHPDCGKTELTDVMKEMKDALKGYKKALKQNDESAMKTHSQSLYDLSLKSKDYIPLRVSDKKALSAEEKTKYAHYQKGMEKMAESVKALINATDNDARKKALAVIGKGNKKGHKAFKMKCKK